MAAPRRGWRRKGLVGVSLRTGRGHTAHGLSVQSRLLTASEPSHPREGKMGKNEQNQCKISGMVPPGGTLAPTSECPVVPGFTASSSSRMSLLFVYLGKANGPRRRAARNHDDRFDALALHTCRPWASGHSRRSCAAQLLYYGQGSPIKPLPAIGLSVASGAKNATVCHKSCQTSLALRTRDQ
jgi:hypothetical protein